MPLPDEELECVISANEARLKAYGSLKPKNIISLVKRSWDRGYVVTEDIIVRGVSAISLPLGGSDGVPAAAITVACVPLATRGTGKKKTPFRTCATFLNSFGEVVLFHYHDGIVNDRFHVDVAKLNPIGRLSGSQYTRVSDLFRLDRQFLGEKPKQLT